MALRFNKKDEVDEEVKENRKSEGITLAVLYGFSFVVMALIAGIFDWLTGRTIKVYAQEAGFIFAMLALPVIGQMVLIPLYNEFRLRSKEIDGKVSAIESAMNSSKKDHAEIIERLAAIEETLDKIKTQ